MPETEIDEDTLKEYILALLVDSDPLSTAEIIEKAEKRKTNCRDKVPTVLMMLWNEKKVKRELSKERRVLLWSLVR
ncbi:MAG: hypothetical protein ACFFCQ_01075 [Promethearchaeota archaeon]